MRGYYAAIKNEVFFFFLNGSEHVLQLKKMMYEGYIITWEIAHSLGEKKIRINILK